VVLAVASALAACGDSQGNSTASDTAAATAPAAAALTLVGAPATEAAVGTSYFFQAYVNNGSGAVTYQVSGKPAWLTLDTSTGILSGTPTMADVGVTNEITLTATSSDAKGSIGPFRVLVKTSGASFAPASNQAPAISGTPPATVRAGQAYTFTPSASDPEGVTLSFSIVNRPGWATFDTTTGRLDGTPGPEWKGSYPQILIRASDGFVSSALPSFSIDVIDAVTGASTANSAPVISGAPNTSVVVGASYNFSPVASDAEGDALTFSIQNKPVWASFNTATGQLTGTPTIGNSGTYANIVITVSDGKLSRSLTAFSIMVSQVVQSSGGNGTALVSWSAPLINADGSMLTDLTGFNIYYGQDPSSLNNQYQLDCSWCLSHLLDSLGPGTWYFTVKAYNKYGYEGGPSALASKTIF
jgi:hypothetical protein